RYLPHHAGARPQPAGREDPRTDRPAHRGTAAGTARRERAEGTDMMIVTVFECRACGERFPVVPYYPHAAPHGPDKNCRAPQGWMPVKETYPPGEDTTK